MEDRFALVAMPAVLSALMTLPHLLGSHYRHDSRCLDLTALAMQPWPYIMWTWRDTSDWTSPL